MEEIEDFFWLFEDDLALSWSVILIDDSGFSGLVDLDDEIIMFEYLFVDSDDLVNEYVLMSF